MDRVTERYEVHGPDSKCGCAMQGMRHGGPHRIRVVAVAGPEGANIIGQTQVNLDELKARELNANEQGEPSTEGTWYLLAIDELKHRGFDAIEVHYPDSDNADAPPNQIVLHKGVFS